MARSLSSNCSCAFFGMVIWLLLLLNIIITFAAATRSNNIGLITIRRNLQDNGLALTPQMGYLINLHLLSLNSSPISYFCVFVFLQI